MLSETSSEACSNTGCCLIGSLPSLTTFTAHHPSVVSRMNSSCQLYESLLCKAKSAEDLTELKISLKRSAKHETQQLTSSSLFTKTVLSHRYILRPITGLQKVLFI